MDDFKRNPSQFDDYDNGDVEIIDTTSDDIEVVDPFESEVIEINRKKDNTVKKSKGYVPPTPTGPVQTVSETQYNASSTVILKKGEQKDDGNKKQQNNNAAQSAQPQQPKVSPVNPAPKAPVQPQGTVKNKFVATPPPGPIKDLDYQNVVNNGTVKTLNHSGEAGTNRQASAPNGAKPGVNVGLAQSTNKAHAANNTSANRPQNTGSSVNPLFAGSGNDTNTNTTSSSSSNKLSKDAIVDKIKNIDINQVKKYIPFIAAGLVVLIILIILLSSSGSATIKVNDYTTITFDGYSGAAKPVVTIDYDKMNSDFDGEIKVDGGGKLSDVVESCISYSISPDTNLSEGDRIILKWTIDKDTFEKKTNGYIKASEMHVKISNLKSMSDFDPFEKLDVQFEGYSSKAILTMTNTEVEGLSELVYTADKLDRIANGDEIVVKISTKAEGYASVEDYCKDNGLNPTATEKKYTVSGLKEYDGYDLFADIDVVYSGISGLGTAKVDVSKVSITGLVYTLSKESKLQNGDRIKVTVSAGNNSIEELLSGLGYSVSVTEMEYVVSGLEEAKDYDPFDELKLTYSGLGPNGELNIESDGVSVAGLVFTANKYSGLSNGDEITIVVESENGSDPADICLEAGLKLKELSKKIVVDGLEYYLDSIKQLDKDAQEEADDASRDIMDGIIKDLMSKSNVKAIELENIYVQYPNSKDVILSYNETFGGDIHNRLFMVYKVTINRNGSSFDYYWPIEFANLIVSKDGAVSYNSAAYIAGLSSFEKDGESYYGYESMDDFEKSCIEESSATYDYETLK